MNEILKDAKTVKERLNLHYRILEIDLTKARNNEELDLERRVNTYNELKILYAPSAFNFRLNDKQNDLIPIRANDQTTSLMFKIDKIFFTNDADTGTAIIWIASRWD